jgi:hypothetical protein
MLTFNPNYSGDKQENRWSPGVQSKLGQQGPQRINYVSKTSAIP